MADQNIDNMSALWNTGGTSYSAIKMNVTDAASAVTSKLIDLRIADSPKFTADRAGNVTATGTITAAAVVSSGTAQPAADDGAALGSPTKSWSDLFLASGGVINWAIAGVSDVTITHTPNQLIFGGASNGYGFDSNVNPLTNDLASLGTALLSWSDLYLATGGEINWGNGNAKLVHSAAALTVTIGDLRVTTAGITATSAVTVGGNQTLTGKTLTAPTINSAVIASPAFTGTPTAAGATWANLGAVTTVAINGGTINNTSIGATTPSTIRGTTITSTGAATFNAVDATVDVSAPVGTFSTSVTGGRVRSGQIFESTATNVILSPAAGLNSIYLRPRGATDGAGQIIIDNAGTLTASGQLAASGNVYSGGTVFYSPGATILRSAEGSAVHLQPYSNGTNQAYIRGDGYFIAPILYATSAISAVGNITAGGSLYGDRLFVNGGTASYIDMQDTDHGKMYIHCNSGYIGFLTNAASWGFRVDNNGAIWCAQLGDINTRIEDRGNAWAVWGLNQCFTSSRAAGEVAGAFNVDSGTVGKQQWSGYYATAVEKLSNNNVYIYFRQPQRYIPNAGWDAAFPF